MLKILDVFLNTQYAVPMASSSRTQMLVDQILRLRRAQALAPEVDEIASVREDLVRQLGPALARGTAAGLIGVSQTALDRWVTSGEIPTVISPRGKVLVPTPVVLDLIEEVRSRGDERHPLAAAIGMQRRRAAQARRQVRRKLDRRLEGPLEGHGAPELRSLALHALVAERLSPGIVRQAQRRLDQLERDNRLDPFYARSWNELLSQPLAQIREALVQDTQAARDLRQTTPFAGVLSEPERRAVLSLVG